jgi:hypothetical protein
MDITRRRNLDDKSITKASRHMQAIRANLIFRGVK